MMIILLCHWAERNKCDLDLTSLNVVGEMSHLHIAGCHRGSLNGHRVMSITRYRHRILGHLMDEGTFRVQVVDQYKTWPPVVRSDRDYSSFLSLFMMSIDVIVIVIVIGARLRQRLASLP